MSGADGASHHPLHGQGRRREDERGRGHRQALRRRRPAHSRALDRSRPQPVRLARGPARRRAHARAATNLFGQEVLAQEEMERHWDGVQEWLGDLLAQRGVDRISAEELTVPPGMDELFSLLWIKRHHEEAEFDCVIVDCAPTGETLRLLSFPDVVTWWLEKVLPWERRLAAARLALRRSHAGQRGLRRRRAARAQPRGHERHPSRPLEHLDPARDEPRAHGREGGHAHVHLPQPLRVPHRRRGGQPRAPGGRRRGLLRRLARVAAGAPRPRALGVRPASDPRGALLRSRGRGPRDARPAGRAAVRWTTTRPRCCTASSSRSW